jgi:transposase
MWTEITRAKYGRIGRRYASDVTDGEWALLEPLLPKTKPLGRPRRSLMREVGNALLYMSRPASTGSRCRRTMPPGPRTTRRSLLKCKPNRPRRSEMRQGKLLKISPRRAILAREALSQPISQTPPNPTGVTLPINFGVPGCRQSPLWTSRAKEHILVAPEWMVPISAIW